MKNLRHRAPATLRMTRETIMARAALREPLEPLSRQEWWRGSALYQVYVRSFRDASGDGIGDLRGVIEKLDYIAGLNVDGFWLSPINPSPQRDFGYDISDLRSIDPIHGDLGDFQELVEGAHERGLKVLMDFIPCHTSDQHPWFAESRASRDGERADWYVWADARPDGGPPNNWLSSFGGPAWTWEPRRAQYYYHPFLAAQPALNLQNPDALDAVIDAMRYWLERGVDGFRMDAVQCLACDPDLRDNPPESSQGPVAPLGGGPHNPFRQQAHLYDRDVPAAFPIIKKMRDELSDFEPERVLIGELADVDSARMSEKYTVEGMGLHAVYDFSLINGPRDVAPLTDILTYRGAFLRTGWLMNVLSNHDCKRAVSDMTAFAEAEGKREDAAKLLFFMQFCLKGGGILFQGEELGLPHPKLGYEDLRDPWGKAFWPDFEGRDGARTPMPWDCDLPNCGFSDAETPWIDVPEEHWSLSVAVQDKNRESPLNFLRGFLAWRQKQPLLKWGGEYMHAPDLAPLIVWDRFGKGRTVTCVANFSLSEQFLPLDDLPEPKLLKGPGMAQGLNGRGLALPPLGFGALSWKGEPARRHGLSDI